MKSKKINALYLISNEELFLGGILWTQAIGVLRELKKQNENIDIMVLYCFPILHWLRNRRKFAELRGNLNNMGLRLTLYPVPFRNLWMKAWVIPFYIAWNLPVIIYIALTYRPRIVHSRSYPAAVLGLVFKFFLHSQMIFDMRGLYVDEGRLKYKSWAKGTLNYRTWKVIEQRLLSKADSVVVVSSYFAKIIGQKINSEKISVVTCTCSAPASAQEVVSQVTAASNKLCLVYNGAIGGWFKLENLLELFCEIRSVLSGSTLAVYCPNISSGTLRSRARFSGITNGSVIFDSLEYQNVIGTINKYQAGILIRHDDIVNHVGFPVKVAEYIMAGVPIITTEASKSVAELVRREELGVVLDPSDPDDIKRKILLLYKRLADYRENVMSIRHLFTSEHAAQLYAQLYRKTIDCYLSGAPTEAQGGKS